MVGRVRSRDEVQFRCEVIIQVILVKLLLILDAVGIEVESLAVITYLLKSFIRHFLNEPIIYLQEFFIFFLHLSEDLRMCLRVGPPGQFGLCLCEEALFQI